ncbi:hypothetical protein GJ496_008058 [Pomphorhynchus laevis]|nr:hypothetical protein GJ496_008058 [Pomphorhynchus laevis]
MLSHLALKTKITCVKFIGENICLAGCGSHVRVICLKTVITKADVLVLDHNAVVHHIYIEQEFNGKRKILVAGNCSYSLCEFSSSQIDSVRYDTNILLR